MAGFSYVLIIMMACRAMAEAAVGTVRPAVVQPKMSMGLRANLDSRAAIQSKSPTLSPPRKPNTSVATTSATRKYAQAENVYGPSYASCIGAASLSASYAAANRKKKGVSSRGMARLGMVGLRFILVAMFGAHLASGGHGVDAEALLLMGGLLATSRR